MANRGIIATAVLGIVAVLGACAGVTDKAGAETLVLRLATIDGEVDTSGAQYGQQAFVTALEDVSDGGIVVELVTTFGDGAAEAESDLVTAIAQGEIDGGWPSTRAFAAAGHPGLKAVEAPLTLVNFDALKEVVDGPAADRIMDALEGSGITPLGVTIAELRRPFATRPLVGVDEWTGMRVRSYNSPVQSDTIAALGGTAVPAGFNYPELVERGELDGAEGGLGIASAVGGGPLPHATTNVVLWPKLSVLSINEAYFASLSAQQQDWIESAAEAGVTASLEGDYDESEFIDLLCSVGMQFHTATEDELEALRERVQPVIDALQDDPAESPLLDEVLAVAASHPEPESPAVPDDCGEGGAGDSIAPIPDGAYRADVTLDDLYAAGVGNSHGYTGTWTITVEDGTYAYTCRGNGLPGTDCGHVPEDAYGVVLEAGYLWGDAESVRFEYDSDLHDRLAGCGDCHPLPDKTVGWALADGRLTFSDIGEPLVDAVLIVKPWTKLD
ncbi:MAG: TRAP transporter substrate-binding protein DctP [Microbacterium sp.]